MDNIIEQKTPKGITIKVLMDKSKFLAFDQKGGSVYADEIRTRILHEIPIIVFIGEKFNLFKAGNHGDYLFLKILKGKYLVPFCYGDGKNQKYLFVKSPPVLDLMPARLKIIRSIPELVKEIEAGLKPDILVVDKGITRGDIIIIKNRYPQANVILADEKLDSITVGFPAKHAEIPVERRATDIASEININMMSNNPVFLARLHLRELNLSKVSQLLFDFDLSVNDVEYILSFLNTMLKRADDKEELDRNRPKIESLRASFMFYSHLLSRNEAEIKEMVLVAKDLTEVASFRTLIAKIKVMFPDQTDQLLFIDYENMLYEKSEGLRQ